MLNLSIWKQHSFFNYYVLATIIAAIAGICYFFDFINQKTLILLLAICIGLILHNLSARMMVIFITAYVSFTAGILYFTSIPNNSIPMLLAGLTGMLCGYSLTFSKGRWFVILYLLSLGAIVGIATFLGLFLPSS